MSENNHYIDNAKFHAALLERNNLVQQAIANDTPIPKISNFLGSCFLQMANNIAYKHNFNRYPFKEEMVCDGIIDCIKYIDTFDVTRHNPFAYFTQAINNAFLRRILREKKQMYVKSKMLSNVDIDFHELQEHDEDIEYVNNFIEYMAIYNNFDGSIFEKPKKEKIRVYTGMTLEEFFNESTIEENAQED